MLKRKFTVLLVTGGVLLLFAVAAMSSPLALGISWWTVDGGGGTSTGGEYVVSGTIGQPDARFSRGGGWEVRGGFWVVDEAEEVVYLPLVTRP